jgi:hypothetical protein
MRIDTRVAALASSLVLIAITAGVPPFVYSDSAIQLKALAQYLAGESPTPNHLVEVSNTDLTTFTREWIVWWPPSTQLTVWPVSSAGLSLAMSVRAVAASGIVIGAIGWARWWSLFELPRALLLAVAVLLPWRRWAANGLFEFSAEVLAFATVPWVLIVAHAIVREARTPPRPSRARAFGAGLVSGAIYWVKYSAVFVSAGFYAALFLYFWRSRTAWTRVLLPVAAGALVPVLVLSIANNRLGGAINMVGQASGLHFTPIMLLYAISNPALSLADAGSLFNFIFTNPVHGLWEHPHIVAVLGVPGGVTIAWLATMAKTEPERLAAIVLAVSVALMVPVWAIAYVSLDERHIAGAASAVAPAILAIAMRRWPAWPATLKWWMVIAALAYLVLPLALYAPALVITKVARTQTYVPTASGFYIPRLSETNARAAVEGLKRACDVAPVVWYIPDALTAIEFRGPMVLDEGFEDIDTLAAQNYRGPVAICALLPARYEANGRADAIRRSFRDIAQWRAVSVPDAVDTLWVGTRAPQP